MNQARAKLSNKLFKKREHDGSFTSGASWWRQAEIGRTRPKACFAVMDPSLRWEIISAYGRILENCCSQVEKESDLPFSKDVIRQAIWEELLENPDGELRGHLEIAFAQLEAFVTLEEFEVIRSFKLASQIAHDVAKSGEPKDIIASARIIRSAGGDRAVRIQEKISEKMEKRLRQVRTLGMGVPVTPVCGCIFTSEI